MERPIGKFENRCNVRKIIKPVLKVRVAYETTEKIFHKKREIEKEVKKRLSKLASGKITPAEYRYRKS